MVFEFGDGSCSEGAVVLGNTYPNIIIIIIYSSPQQKKKGVFTSISDDNIKLTRLLFDILASSLIILFIPRIELYRVDIGVFGGEVFEGLSGWVAGTCEDDGVGAFGDSGGEAETNTAVSTGDYTSRS